MPITTLEEAAKLLDKPAKYHRRVLKQVMFFPVQIVDARTCFGRIEFGFVPRGWDIKTDGPAPLPVWATESSLILPEKGVSNA